MESIIEQEYRNWELIIVDDGSTDETPSIIETYVSRDERIRLIRHDTNRRLPGSLNTGHSTSKGMYFTWTSDDNLYKKNALHELVRFLKDNPNIGFVYSDYSFIDSEGKVFETRRVPEPETLPYFPGVGACFLYRRNVWEEVGSYNEELFCIEDYEYWLRVSQKFTMATLHKDLYFYRMHGDSLTARKKSRQLEGMRQALRMHLPHIRWAPRKSISKGWMAVAGLSYHQKDTRWLVYGLCKAFTLNPIGTIRYMITGLKRNV